MKNPGLSCCAPSFTPPHGSRNYPVKNAPAAALAVFLTLLLLVLAACPAVNDLPVPVTGVSLDKTSLSLRPGGSAALSARVSPDNASNQAVLWTSNAAAVDNAGTVRAVSAGTAVITVTTLDGGEKAASVTSERARIEVNNKVNARAPAISAQPQGAVYAYNTAAAALTVAASVSDGGTLSYQWYSNAENSNSGGTRYYTIADNGDGGEKAAPAASEPAQIVVSDRVNARAPAISAQPQGAVYAYNGAAAALTVEASVSDGGTLSYQWYRAADETGEGTALDGATAASCTPPTATLETVYYYAAVTNTLADNGDGGEKAASVTSERARIVVSDRVNARAPAISVQPQGADYDWGGTASLSVTASSPDGGTLSYQWYRNTANSASGGTALDGETAASYTPPTTALGTVYYYYVTVTNTLTDNGDGGAKTAFTDSAVAAVSVSLKSAASVGNYITDNPGAGTQDNPVPLPVKIGIPGDWAGLLTAIQGAGKYVSLDLSACTMAGTKFNPQPGASDAGESKIVSLVLPRTAESVKADDDSNPNFRRFSALKSIEGSGVTAVGNYAFYQCRALTTVSLPAATDIGYRAFNECSALTTVSLPVATSIGGNAFEGCSALKTVNLPAATSIGTSTFHKCSALTTVSLPVATSIGGNAFQGCSALTTVNLPASLTSLGSRVFAGCTALTTITVNDANPSYSGRGGMLLDKAGTTLIAYPGAKGNVTLEASITTIGIEAFQDCTALKSVEGPGVTGVGQSAFYGCYVLEEVSLPAATSIGTNAFYKCTALTTVSLPAATSVGTSAFYKCTALTTVSLPAATSVGTGAFSDCTALTTVSLPAATSIGDIAFYNCTALTTVSLPAAQSIRDMAFAYTGGLALEITLGSAANLTAPALRANIFSYVSTDKAVTVKVPSGATGYGGTPPLTYSGSDSTAVWGNGFRGKGWTGTAFSTGTLNDKITLTIETITP